MPIGARAIAAPAYGAECESETRQSRAHAVDDEMRPLDGDRARIVGESELHRQLLRGDPAEQPFVAAAGELEARSRSASSLAVSDGMTAS